MHTPLIKRPSIVLLVIAVLAYWQAAFGVLTFKWDMLDVVLPFRYFAGECIHHGVFPLWNPYLLTGRPVFADLQYPLWSPEVWLAGLISGYSVYLLHFLFLFYLVLAGYGMYRLTLHFNNHPAAALVAGTAYMLSGFFTGHGQALFAIVGAAWLPWVVLYMIKNCQRPSVYRTIKLAVLIFLMISTGYQFISIMTGYLLFAILVYYGTRNFKTKETLRRLVLYNALLFILVVLMCLVIVVPVFQVPDYNLRLGAGVRYAKAITNSFTWPSLISLIAPFSTVKYPEYFGTNISQRNMFVGLTVLLAFAAGVLKKKQGIQWIILGFGLVCLLASFGPSLPLHKLMYRFLPLVRNLRMPAYFNLFFVFAVIFIAGLHLRDLFNRDAGILKNLRLLCMAAAGIMGILLIFSIFHLSRPLPDPLEFFRHPDAFLQSLNFHDHIVIQVPLQILIVLSLFYILKTDKNGNRLPFRVSLLVVIEMITAVNFNSYFTVYSRFRPGHIQGFLNSQPEGFPVPDSTPVGDNSDQKLRYDPLWRNMGILTKKLSYDGFSSFVLDPFNFLDDSVPSLRDALIRNPPVYFSGKVYRIGEARINSRNYTNGDLFIPDEVYNALPVNLERNVTTDRLKYVSFSPNQFTVDCKLDTASVITYLQAEYPGWQVSIDGEKTRHFTSNYMFISALVPAGEHRVTFRYQNPPVFASFIFSYTVFIILLCAIIYLAFWGTSKDSVR